MTDKTYMRIPFKNAYVGVANRKEFEEVLEQVKAKLETLDIKRLWLNHVEMLDVENTISCIKSMSVNQVIESEIQVELM